MHIAEFVKRNIPANPDTLNEDDLLYDGVRYRGVDQVGKLCRVLGNGVLQINRNGKPACMVWDVASRAKKSLQENKTHGFRMVKYAEFAERVKR